MTEHRNSERDRDQSGDVIEGARRDASARPYGILIVDDEEAILESLELTLGQLAELGALDHLLGEGDDEE